jgi:hypothetical protein
MAKKTNYYFAEREEKAVVDYICSDSGELKNQIYNEILIEPFRIMIEVILRKYPIHIGNYTMEEVEQFALNHLIDQMVKYRTYIIESKPYDIDDKWNKLGDGYRFINFDDVENKLDYLNNVEDGCDYRIFKSKAYSYCQTIVRNYFKDWSKKTYADKIINLNYDDYFDEINQKSEFRYEITGENDSLLDKLMIKIVSEIENKLDNDTNIKKNELIVGEAVVNVLKNWDILFLEDTPEGTYNKKVTNKFAKNKVLLFLKEQTGLNTKEIRMALKPFKELYFLEKEGLLSE